MAGSGEVYTSSNFKSGKPFFRNENLWGKSLWHYPNRYKDGPAMVYNGRVLHKPAYGLQKWWDKHHTYNGLVIEYLSPYQTRPLHTLFRDFVPKLIMKPDWPRLIGRSVFHLYYTVGLISYAKWRHDWKLRMSWD